MIQLRQEQGITESMEHVSEDLNGHTCIYDTFDVCSTDFTDEGSAVSGFKMMLSILNSEFKLAQQVDEHLAGAMRKGPNKFPRMCALLCLLEIIGQIASKLLKYIVFEEGNFSRPNSTSDKFISSNFINAAREYVNNYLANLPIINNRRIIYIDKSQVERSFIIYLYVESTTKILFDTSNLNHMTTNNEETQSINRLSVQ